MNKDEKLLLKNIDRVIEVNKLNTIVKINFNYLILPYQRHRFSGRGKYLRTYDPLSEYKKEIRKNLKSLFKNFNITENPIEIEIKSFIDVPKSTTLRKKLNIFRNLIKPIQKPDVDNIAKTSMDLFYDIIWKDDNQVYKLISIKEYDLINPNRVEIIIKFNNEIINNNGRILKEEKNSLTNEEYRFLYKKEKEI